MKKTKKPAARKRIRQVSSRQARRERFKAKQYKLADERDANSQLRGKCVLCFCGIPGGSIMASAHHEIEPKSEIRGESHWEELFALSNIAPACQEHHTAVGHIRWLWKAAMVHSDLVSGMDYEGYYTEPPRPVFKECLFSYGYGTRYYRDNIMDSSLKRLYERSIEEFSILDFCDTCSVRKMCKEMAEGR